MNNIILCGFMGCGKTTVGKRLASRLAREYIDLDADIEVEAGIPIPAIFEQYGEAHFRTLEHEAVQALSKRINCIVSTGGGAMTFPRNVAAIDPQDKVFFLDASFEVCYNRIRNSDRPIVRSSTPEALRLLFHQRREAYLAAASVCINADCPTSRVTQAILEHLTQPI